jgi:hypothetical protein
MVIVHPAGPIAPVWAGERPRENRPPTELVTVTVGVASTLLVELSLRVAVTVTPDKDSATPALSFLAQLSDREEPARIEIEDLAITPP